MTGIGMVRSARKDVVQLQSALTAVDAGLETVEVAAEAVRSGPVRRAGSRARRLPASWPRVCKGCEEEVIFDDRSDPDDSGRARSVHHYRAERFELVR